MIDWANYAGRIVTMLTALLVNVGWYMLSNGNGNTWGVLSLMASIPALGWFLGKRYDLVKSSAEKDELTDVYNRRGLKRIFAKVRDAANWHNEKVVIAVVDVDHFKRINDLYGHMFGDRVLKHVACVLSRAVWRGGYVVRWGGDEFLVIIPNADHVEMDLFLQRLDHHLSESSSGISESLSLSIGFAIYPDDCQQLEDLMRIADGNMYKCKEKRA
jgi:diguanylate cyclase (GGDEF)-like protein